MLLVIASQKRGWCESTGRDQHSFADKKNAWGGNLTPEKKGSPAGKPAKKEEKKETRSPSVPPQKRGTVHIRAQKGAHRKGRI